MSSPATFNRKAIGRLWNLADLPVEWPGYRILLKGDLDKDLAIDEEELDAIDWIVFSEAVGDFQLQEGIAPQDSKLGPDTLKRLRESYGLAVSPPDVLKTVGDLIFKTAKCPVSEPQGPPAVGHTQEEKVVCNLWNNYGKAIHEQALAYDIPIEATLAVFYVESKKAYDPATGLLIIRYEPHVFLRKSGREIPFDRRGQNEEWRNFERAYAVDQEAALLSCSYGLPQLMGFNWKVTKHTNVREMVLAFQGSCVEQISGFFGFVEKNNLIKHIENEDWRAFTRAYNGPGNVDDYSGKIIRALKVINNLKQDGVEFKV